MGTVLSRVIFPQKMDTPQSALYYRSSQKLTRKDGQIFLPANTAVSFDTYFNALFYQQYLKGTSVKTVRISICLSGHVSIRGVAKNRTQSRLIFERRLCGRDMRLQESVSLPPLPPDGMLYCEIKAWSDTYLESMAYETDIPPQHAVRLAAVICTYHREQYVSRNIRRIQERIWSREDCPIRNDLDIFIVDNGNTLSGGPFIQTHVKIFPNKNLGGSGGFARGVMEVLASEVPYTHILLMDDDVSLEPEILVKTFQFLRCASAGPQPLCIGGHMLQEDAPTIQQEAGGVIRGGRLFPLGHGLDLSLADDLLKNTEIPPPLYTAWWFCVLPAEVFRKYGLPLPFFIKMDDVEYAVRVRPRILLMNGIGVWHRSFDKKHRPYLEYYVKRNELIFSAIHGIDSGVCAAMRKLLLAAGKAVLKGELSAIPFLCKAYQDFLAGPGFFQAYDLEKVHAERTGPRGSEAGAVRTAVTFPFRFLVILARFICRYQQVQEAYRAALPWLTSADFWRKCLRIS